MRQRWGAGRAGMLGLVIGALAWSACGRKGGPPVPEPPPVSLEIHNHGFADVDVYVVPSPGAASSVRLTTVSGFASTTVSIRQLQLQPGNALQVQLHPIGSRVHWTSPQLSVSPGERVELDINADAAGSLVRTVLYPLPDTSDAPAPLQQHLRLRSRD